MWRFGSAAALAVFLSLAPSPTQAQSSPRLVREPTYGTVQRIAGETLLIAEIKPSCPAAAQLSGEFCFDEVIAAMRTGAVTSAAVLGVRGQAAIGSSAQGEIFDVRSNAGQYTATARTDGRTGVRVPRNCFAMPGETARYSVHRLAIARVAAETQLIVCDGAVPPQPWATQTPALLPIGATAPAPNHWPATSAPTLTGEPMPFAARNPACAEGATLRDDLCFASAIARLQQDPTQQVVIIGADVQAAAGMTVQEVDQYTLRQRRNRYDVDKRWFDRAMITAPDGCGVNGALSYQISEQGAGQFFATPSQRARCGPPMAPDPVAIYEFFGEEVLLVAPASCPPQEQLANACYGHVMSHMRQTGARELQVVSLGAYYRSGTVIAFRGSGSIGYDLRRITASPDFTQFSVNNINTYRNGIRPASGCRLPSDWIPGSEGVVVSGNNRVGRFFQWYACPAR